MIGRCEKSHAADHLGKVSSLTEGGNGTMVPGPSVRGSGSGTTLPLAGYEVLTSWKECLVHIGEQRRTIFIEPIEEPAPVEEPRRDVPTEPAVEPRPVEPDPAR